MRNTFKILFYLKRSSMLRNGQAPIMGRITINGVRAQFSTRLSVPPAAWDISQNRAIGRTSEILFVNCELDAIRRRLEQCYSSLIGEMGHVTSAMVRSRYLANDNYHEMTLLTFVRRHNESVNRSVGVDRSRSTYYKYHSVGVHLENYLVRSYGRGDLLLSELDRDFLVGFHGYLLREAGRRKNTVWVYLTALKHVLAQARSKGLPVADLFADYKLRSEHVERNYLSTAELNRLSGLASLSPSMRLVRDSFLFSCFTGLSFVDMKQLRRTNLRRIGQQWWIETTRRKTGSQVQVRLFDLPYAILHKYMPDERSQAIFPLPSNSWCNHCLEVLMKQAGIAKRITFHCARHTFATTLTLSQGMSIETISKLLGHSNIRTTQIYATITREHIGSEMNRLSKRLDTLCMRWQA